MKKIIIGALLLMIATATFSQQTNPIPTLTKQDYLRKSKNGKAFAWAAVSTGAVITILGAVKFNFAGTDSGKPEFNTGTFVAGLIIMGISIPFFIAASKNRKKAMSLSLNNQPMPYIINGTMALRPQPSIHLKIAL